MLTAVPDILNCPQRYAEDTVSFRLVAQIVPSEAADVTLQPLSTSLVHLSTPGERGGLLRRLIDAAAVAPTVALPVWPSHQDQRRRRGADINWEPDYATGTPLDAASGLSTRQENVISWLRELGARSSRSD